MAETGMQQERKADKGQSPQVRRRSWTIWLLILGGLIALGVGALVWTANVHRHRASTYGITDPSGSALRIENRASDFAIIHVTIADAQDRVVFRDEIIEIGMGAASVFEISPGTYLVTVHYVEINQAVMGRPQGALSESIAVSSGRAVLLSLQGGRSSPEGSIFLPPVFVLK